MRIRGDSNLRTDRMISRRSTSGKDNLVLSQMKPHHSEFVGARIGFKGAVNFRTQEFIKQTTVGIQDGPSKGDAAVGM